MKNIIILSLLSLPLLGQLIDGGHRNAPKESLQTDVSEMCMYQETSTMALGTEVCSDDYFLSITGTAAVKGLTNYVRVADSAGEVANSAFYQANGNGDFVGNRTIYVTDGVTGADSPIIQDYIVDTANATGTASMPVIRVIKSGTGDIEVAGLAAAPGVIPVVQAFSLAGFKFADIALKYDDSLAAFTDITTQAASAGTNVDLFDEDNDILYIGDDFPFGLVELNLAVNADTSIVPTFEYWNGSAWTSFSPSDASSGLTTSGEIAWAVPTLTGWVTTAVDGNTKYWIRIVRTEDTITTLPTESTIRQVGFVEYRWGEDGIINIKELEAEKQRLSLISAEAGESALDIQVNINGESSTSGTNSTFTATDLPIGEFAAIHDNLVDKANSGVFSGIATVRTFELGTGSADVRGSLVGPGVGPILQGSGGLAAANTVQKYDDSGASFTNITTEAGDSGTNVDIFEEDNDIVYVGEDATFDVVEFNLAGDSNKDILAVFEYWNGSTWTAFSPSDMTNGMQTSGNISWSAAALTGWATTSVNSITKYYIRITRTQGSISMVPTESTIRTTGVVLYGWDEDGVITAKELQVENQKITVPSSSLPTCDADELGSIKMYVNGNNTGFCGCRKDGASSYSWAALHSGISCP